MGSMALASLLLYGATAILDWQSGKTLRYVKRVMEKRCRTSHGGGGTNKQNGIEGRDAP
jgi:hypothetical protein